MLKTKRARWRFLLAAAVTGWGLLAAATGYFDGDWWSAVIMGWLPFISLIGVGGVKLIVDWVCDGNDDPAPTPTPSPSCPGLTRASPAGQGAAAPAHRDPRIKSGDDDRGRRHRPAPDAPTGQDK